MAKELKRFIVQHLASELAKVDGCVLVDFQRLNSEKTLDLRAALRKRGVRMTVVHNRLARLAFGQRKVPESFQRLFRGPTAVLFGPDGALSASKSIVEWRKKNAGLAPIKGGLFGGRVMTPEQVEDLARIPEREVIQAGVASRMLGMLGVLATAAQSVLSFFAGAAKARHEELSKGIEASGK